MEYILDARTYLPKFLHESKLMLSIVDCLNALISSEQPCFEQIQEAYQDALYRCKDYSKLTYEAKINIIKELGFEYLIDILTLSSEQLTQLLIFFNLIYTLKGKKEGLKICLDTLGINYTYTTWDEMIPKGIRFTANLNIIGNDYSTPEVFAKIRNFIRSYMLPWVNITIELTFDAPPFYIYPCGFLNMGTKNYNIYSATRDVVNVALYDQDLYDNSYYGVEIHTAPHQDDPYIFEDVALKIICNKSDAIIKINNEETNEKLVEKGSLNYYSILYNETLIERTIVCNDDKNIVINF